MTIETAGEPWLETSFHSNPQESEATAPWPTSFLRDAAEYPKLTAGIAIFSWTALGATASFAGIGETPLTDRRGIRFGWYFVAEA